LVQRIFAPKEDERRMLLLVDLPDEQTTDHILWMQRREIACEWATLIPEALSGFEVQLAVYRNVRRNNADLPEQCVLIDANAAIPEHADALDELQPQTFDALLAARPLVMALTEFSATAPLKLAARAHGFRGATMGGFNEAMLPAIALDYREVNARVSKLAALLSAATSAELQFETCNSRYALNIDLRYREPHISGGLFLQPGTVGNLPSGETYIVPYEGEREGEPSQTQGVLPVQIGDELVRYEIAQNRAASVLGEGPIAQRERMRLAQEPAYGNIAELGLGVLADFDIKPIGEVLLDEKLGLHVAFGRSDHFGGTVGSDQFSCKEAVCHIDRVYIPETQPKVTVSLTLVSAEGRTDVMEEGRYLV
jgi:leucyl aminopeptidase (aminopeptidase T)